MTLFQQLAQIVADTLNKDADRYTQVHAIQQTLIANGNTILAEDRDTVDSTLDVLFKEYGYRG